MGVGHFGGDEEAEVEVISDVGVTEFEEVLCALFGDLFAEDRFEGRVEFFFDVFEKAGVTEADAIFDGFEKGAFGESDDLNVIFFLIPFDEAVGLGLGIDE